MNRTFLTVAVILFLSATMVYGQGARGRFAVQEPVLSLSGHYDNKLALEFKLHASGEARGTVETAYGERDEDGVWDYAILTKSVSGTWTLMDGKILIMIENEKSEWETVTNRLTFPNINGITVEIRRQPPKDVKVEAPSKKVPLTLGNGD